MDKTKILSLSIINILIAVSFGCMAYLQTYLINYFEWGSTNNDGLFMIIVPLYVMPILFLLLLIKGVVLRKLKLPVIVKKSYIAYFVLTVLIFGTISSGTSLFAMVLSLIAGILAIIESFYIIREVKLTD